MISLKIIAVLFLIDSVISITDVNLNNVPLETASSLLSKLSEYGNDVKYIQIEPNIPQKGSNYIDNDYVKQNKRFVRPNGIHKLLIKRLIPHDFPTSVLEFDAKYKSLYKPLVRVHKRKPIPKIGTILNIGNNIGLDKYGIDFHDYYDNDENEVTFVNDRDLDNLDNFNLKNIDVNSVNEALLQPFLINDLENDKMKEDSTSHLEVLRKIKKLMKNNLSVQRKIKTFDHIKQILDKMEILRSQDKSGEENDPMIPGALSHHTEDVTTKPKKYVPHYPPWNYWTYNKSIHQDMCPPGQVKIANRCIVYPPH